MTTYSIGWAVITLICIVSVVLISKELGQKEKELADERNKITELTGNFDEMVCERNHLRVIVCSLEKEKNKLEEVVADLGECLTLANKECEIYQAILIEHGLWTEPTEAAPDEGTYEEAVEETPAELPPGEIVCDEVEEENNPSVSEADSSLPEGAKAVEVENEDVD